MWTVLSLKYKEPNRAITSSEEEIALFTIISRQLQIWETEGKSMKMFFPLRMVTPHVTHYDNTHINYIYI
jgi:hypothetical protein